MRAARATYNFFTDKRLTNFIALAANIRLPLLPPPRLQHSREEIVKLSDGRSGMESSLVVSMEINGVMYQGVLFALNPAQAGVTNPLRIHAGQSLI